MKSSLKSACLCWVFIATVSQAGVFEDDEARRAILDLRQRVENLRQSQIANDAALQKSLDGVNKSQQAVRDTIAQEVQQESSRIQQALLQLQAQIDSLKQNIAEMRGENDQLQREITLLKRGQNDNSSGLEERLLKFEQRIAKLEPVIFQIDGLEFQADPTKKKDFELALATFRKGDFAGSIITFSSFLRKYPDSGFRQSALFWLASAKYVKREYTDAVNQLKSFASMSETHAKFPEALLTLANAQLELKQSSDAKKTLDELISKFPSSEAAAASKERLSKLK